MKCFAILFVIFSASASLMAFPAGKVLQETIELAAKVSGKTLSRASSQAAVNALTKAAQRYGDDVIRLTRAGGLEALDAGAKYGDGFWRLAKRATPEGARSLALHADELMPLAKRFGDDFLRLEGKVPGLGAEAVRLFGDDSVSMLAKAPASDLPRLVGFARRSDSPEATRLLLEKYSKHGSAFLDKLNWKQIMASGLSVAAITAAYKISDGVETGIEIIAEKHPDRFKESLSVITAPVRWGIVILLAALFGPMCFRFGCYLVRRKKVPDA